MNATPSARPSRGFCQSDISATVRNSVCTRGWPAESSSRNAIGSLLSSFAISSRKLSMANALWALPTPRKAESRVPRASTTDRKSTRLNSSHANISYAVFCLKKKKKKKQHIHHYKKKHKKNQLQ